MGIQGLLPLLKDSKYASISPIQESHLRNFKNTAVAIDAYSWLHKGVYGHASEIFLHKNSEGITDYCMKRIKMLLVHRITPILVFDGDYNPLKLVEEKRESKRENAKKMATDLLSCGRNSEAYKYMAQAINVTHEMAVNLMRAARSEGVECIVAPYEADAQLAYLEKEGYVQAIITEDSDMVIYGCQKILFKLQPDGSVQLYSRDMLPLYMQKKFRCTEDYVECLRFAGIMAGCDYIENIPKVGITKAIQFIVSTVRRNPREFLTKINQYMKLETFVDNDYVDKYMMAYFAFLHPIVFDPLKRKRVHFQEGDDNSEDYLKFKNIMRKEIDVDAYQLALGNININGKVDGSYNPEKSGFRSIFVSTAKIIPEEKSLCSFGQLKKVGTRGCRPVADEVESPLAELSFQAILSSYKEIERVEEPKRKETPIKKLRPCKFAKKRKLNNHLDETTSSYFNKTAMPHFDSIQNDESYIIITDDESGENVSKCYDDDISPFCETEFSSSTSESESIPPLKEIQNITPKPEEKKVEEKRPEEKKKSPEKRGKKKPKQTMITNFFIKASK